MKAAQLRLTRTQHRFLPDPKRVITRPFIPGEEGFVYGQSRVALVLERILAIPEEQVQTLLDEIRSAFSPRHHDFTKVLDDHFQLVSRHLKNGDRISSAQRLLIGAYFTHEYAIEGAALFNPSLVPAPDQSGLPRGALRFVMSLRAVGEGHISSIAFRSGIIGPRGKIVFDARSPFVSTGHRTPNPSYKKEVFKRKLKELELDNDLSRAVLRTLADRFSFTELTEACASSKSRKIGERTRRQTIETIHWLATSNYEVEFRPDSPVSERVIFPASPNESRGMEDARFVRFVDDDRTVRYYATYTAYDGHDILPQLIETTEFVTFSVRTLNGHLAVNKGMALFPRRIGGKFAMLSRHDSRSIHFMTSDDIRFWHEAETIQTPQSWWEIIQIGNCGSPIETEAGWLVLTHGVGPMRRYVIGAMLLDLDDPRRVIGKLNEPFLVAEQDERDGYVPNVAYTCGAIVHNGRLVLPYGFSDMGVRIATVPLADLLSRLNEHPRG